MTAPTNISDEKPMPRVTVVFWSGDQCVITTSDTEGKFELNVEPGRYGCAWTTDGDRVLKNPLFTPDLRQLLLVELKAGENPALEVPARLTFRD